MKGQETSPGHCHWEITGATTFDVYRWSFGRVAGIPDLYDPRTFGPEKDLACACGKYVGDDAVGVVCDECGVVVSDDSESCRKLRLGHIELACPCPNPFRPTVCLDAFPIAPISLRLGADGKVTEIGRKYEALVEANNVLAHDLPEKGAPGYYESIIGEPGTAALLVEAIRDITEATDENGGFTEGSLITMFTRALVMGDSCASSILRSCGFALKVIVTL